MIKTKTKRTTVILYVLAVLLLAGCGKEGLSEEETGTIRVAVEDIPEKEPPREEEKQQEAENGQDGQDVSQDFPEENGGQSVPKEAGDETVKSDGRDSTRNADQKKAPEEAEKDAGSARLQKYQSVLTDVIEKHIYPDGTDCGFNGSDGLSDNKFAVFDVDKDGQKELILCITSASTAGMREVVYDYDEKKDSLREEYSGFPGGVFYENGLIEEGLSHNQGMAPLGDFWPYMLHRYQAESDSYQCTFIVDAWEKEYMAQDYDGNPYPDEIDEEKSGIVYYLMEGGAYDPASAEPVSKSIYEEWRKEQGLGGAGTEIPFLALTEENVRNI